MGGYKTDYYLHKYLLHLGKRKDYADHVPLLIRLDPLVRFVKLSISNATCPFCFKKFAGEKNLVMHLRRNKTCRARLDEFINHTVDRYLLFRSYELRRKIKPILEKYYVRDDA